MNFKALADIFFPPECLACAKKIFEGVICASCKRGIAINGALFCGTCGARFPELEKTCHPETPYFLGAAGNYDDKKLRALIHGLKFRRITAAAHPIADIVCAYIKTLAINLETYTIMPIPLSGRRQRERGFNQSALIAKDIATRFGLPMEERFLVRVKNRKPQSETENILERRKNIEGCFAVTEVSAGEIKNVILIDDVTTSGATFLEAARTLKIARVKKIIAFAAAKA